MINLLWLIPLLPLAGAVTLLAGARAFSHRTTAAVGVGAVGATLVMSLGALVQFLGHHRATGEAFAVTPFRWIAAGELSVDLTFRLDPLSAVMLFLVTFVGLLIPVFSAASMHGEPPPAYARFFAYLNLSMFGMLLLVLGGNLLVLFAGWEGVSLATYLLIGFYYRKGRCAEAGQKAFVVNRIGDLGFLLAIFVAFKVFGTLDIAAMREVAAADPAAVAPWATAIALLLFVGAAAASAQFPLHVWLPDTVAGPTPASALIQSATVVTAGVYLVARTGFLFALSPEAMLTVAVVGGVTAFFAAVIGLAQNDINKVLAYSTVSQLGYMFLAAGSGAFAAAVFHVFTHAFFKACLFLGSGSVIRACGGEQDMRRMGGLKDHLPITYRTFLIAALALAGIPPLAGFFSRDEILARVFAAGTGNLGGFGTAYTVLWGLGAAGAFLTAFYMFRTVNMTFHGAFRGDPETATHLHESPPVMTWPLKILAGFSAAAGLIGVSTVITFGWDVNIFGRFVEHSAPVADSGHHPALAVGWLLIALSVAVALAGIVLARRFYTGPWAFETPARLAAKLPWLYRLVAGEFYVDEAYDRIIVRPLAVVARSLWKGIDMVAIDGPINAIAFFTEITGDLLRFLHTGNVRNYALLVMIGAVAAAAWLLW